MFGSLVTVVQTGELGPPPKDVPPPTPIRLPQCNPELSRDPQPSLVRFLQQLQRPAELSEAHFAALGVHVHADAPAEDVLPDPSYLPVFSEWEGVSLDEAARRDETFRRPLCNKGKSPDARFFLERRDELSLPNQAAFRTVRRVKPPQGKQQPRLGNSYEFYKQMELMASYWDDTSLPPLVPEDDEEEPPPLPPRPTDASSEQPAAGAAPESNARSEADPEAKPEKEPQRTTYRTSAGSQMPAEFRHNFVSAFVRLIAYPFGCNIIPPRVEPRLQLLSPPFRRSSNSKGPFSQTASYFPSGCVFLCKSPLTREAARSGIVEGPIAAVSARNTTNFNSPADSNIDFGRELVAALITAQHRAREGQPEKRFGEGKWWATEKRWGGGEGGPIGREVDGDSVVGDKDAAAPGESENTEASKPVSSSSSSSSSSHQKGKPSSLPLIPMRGQPVSKKPRKNMSIYDSYRMVRLPSSNWDKKTVYAPIGKVKGVEYDDVFVLSSLFHHFSVLRVRVPRKLLDVLGGEWEGIVEAGIGAEGEKLRSWGKLEMWRSRWFDLFIVEERLEAMRLLWGMMAWVMRVDEDVVMKNT
ncbi:uncharacterized protein GGS22DRAFT_78498 [Annulohypoxylon maeteangense]|uniref:uncharacterized protein n=1 Tax=Annulohypoxylon maeteangense TaxID=1927788 RepID=UPI002007278F|nr:uncharacterized protein GGS22DRAFT_78498 [Annulohypoxylon maeteangense]KAI0880976.1 hypothetical protein GGS22DRAFT_78498 [Annulohypoxylon maeteangense]